MIVFPFLWRNIRYFIKKNTQKAFFCTAPPQELQNGKQGASLSEFVHITLVYESEAYFCLDGGFDSFSLAFEWNTHILFFTSVVEANSNWSFFTRSEDVTFLSCYPQMLFEKCVSVYASSIHSWLQAFVQKEQPFFSLVARLLFVGVHSYSLCFVSLLGVLKTIFAFLPPWLVP